VFFFFFFSSRRRHTRSKRDWSSDVCSSDLALFALFFPIVAIPGAATTDRGTFTITGFWGSASTPSPPTGWSWGPGLGWWILLLAVVSGSVGAILPYVKSIRAMIPAPPPGWRPPS